MGKDETKSEDSKFGFKDKAKADETIELLKEHELQYQKLTVRGLLGRAKRVLSSTFLKISCPFLTLARWSHSGPTRFINSFIAIR